MTATALPRSFRGITGTVAVAATVFLGGGTSTAVDEETITDAYLFELSLPEFEDVRTGAPYPALLDWSSDVCSWSPDEPLGYDFTPACHRHDFGYRNYKDQGRFTEPNRKAIDDNFYSDMKVLCGGNWDCNGAAWTYYQAVRQFGAS